MIFNNVLVLFFFPSSSLSCCPVQKMGWMPLPFSRLAIQNPWPLSRHVWPFSRHALPFYGTCHLFAVFFPLPTLHNLHPGSVFIFIFFAIPEVEWGWQRLLLCCLATSFGFGPCPFGLCWHFWPPTIRALSSFTAAASAAPAAGAGLALLCACQIMVVKNGMV